MVNGAQNGNSTRSGARTLNLLAAPLNSQILQALRDGPKQQVDLRREAGHPAQTTLRAQLKRVHAAGVVEKRRRNRFPGVLEYELTEAGRSLLVVADVLQRWLESSPAGRIVLGDAAAKAAVKALTDGWSTTMLHALAAEPLTLTELDGVIAALNYPSVERRLAAMRIAGLVEPCGADRRGTPYGATAWARQSIAPFLTAARWELCHSPGNAAPFAELEVETAFLLAAGLLSPPADASGSCRLAVEVRDGRRPRLAGLLVTVRDGRASAVETRLEGKSDAWASGPVPAWLAALVERDLAGLELGGDGALARTLVDSLHGALFPLPVA